MWQETASTLLPASPLPDIPTRTIAFETTEGTMLNVDVSPDGQTLVFDLLGDLYLLPIDGGEAVTLTSGRAWDTAPRFSPDGTAVIFVSDREGYKQLWHVTIASSELRQVTMSSSDMLGTPNWSEVGRRVLVSQASPEDNAWDIVLQSVDPNNGTMTPIDPPSGPVFDWDAGRPLRPIVRVFSGVQSAAGQIYFAQQHMDLQRVRLAMRLHRYELATQTRIAITPEDAAYSDYKPQMSHDGRLLSYLRQHQDRRTEIRVLELESGDDRSLVELPDVDDVPYTQMAEGAPNYAFTPDNQYLVFWHGGKLKRVMLADGSVQTVPFHVRVGREVRPRLKPPIVRLNARRDASVIRWPSVSRDGSTLAFAAVGYVWTANAVTGRTHRVTNSNDLEYMPGVSPDGRFIAYVQFPKAGADFGSGQLVIANLVTGSQRTLLADEHETYLSPTWSEDGKKIAVIRESKLPDQPQATAEFGWTGVDVGEFHTIAPAVSSDAFAAIDVDARFVGFDAPAEHLLFSNPASRTEIVLSRAALNGDGSVEIVAVGQSDVIGIVPAPDAKHLGLKRGDDTIWVVPFEIGGAAVEVTTEGAQQASSIGGHHIKWNGSDQVVYAFAANAFRYDLSQASLDTAPLSIDIEAPSSNQPIAFTGARLITMAERGNPDAAIEGGTLVVDGHRITAVGKDEDVTIPLNAVVIDATGKTIMPGLVDVHYHRIGGTSGGGGLSGLKLPGTGFSDRSAIAYGITTAWEPGGPLNDGVPATVDLQATGRILGPRWSHAARGAVGSPWELLSTIDDARAAVARDRAHGVTVLKEYSTPTRQQRQWLVTAAREKQLGIVSHLDTLEGMLTRIVDGYTGGDHPYIPAPYFKDVREMLRQSGYIWTPNIVISTGGVGGYRAVQSYFLQRVREYGQEHVDRLRRMTQPQRVDAILNTHPGVSYEAHRIRRVAQQVASAAEDGVNIAVSAHNMPGVNLHAELWYLQKGGLSPAEALRLATIGNAAKLGLQQEIGSLETGKFADLLILNANPLEDVIHTLEIEYTVQGGVVYDADTVEIVGLGMYRQ